MNTTKYYGTDGNIYDVMIDPKELEKTEVVWESDNEAWALIRDCDTSARGEERGDRLYSGFGGSVVRRDSQGTDAFIASLACAENEGIVYSVKTGTEVSVPVGVLEEIDNHREELEDYGYDDDGDMIPTVDEVELAIKRSILDRKAEKLKQQSVGRSIIAEAEREAEPTAVMNDTPAPSKVKFCLQFDDSYCTKRVLQDTSDVLDDYSDHYIDEGREGMGEKLYEALEAGYTIVPINVDSDVPNKRKDLVSSIQSFADQIQKGDVNFDRLDEDMLDGIEKAMSNLI